MNRARSLIAACATAAASLFFVAPAMADTMMLEGGCEFQGGADCTASCTGADFSVVCNGDVEATCSGSGMCAATADVNCNGSCSTSCNTACTANPGTFTCSGQCEADCGGHCDAECNGSASSNNDGASSQADCSAKCNASCKGRCEGSCQGTLPTATCDAKCSSSCSGSCTAQANFKCDIMCSATGSGMCVANYQSQCMSKCSAGGVVTCDSGTKKVIEQFVADAKAAADWVAQHITYSGEASASCMGNTCSAQAQGQASTNCAAAPLTTNDSGIAYGLGGALGAIAIGGVIRRRRARKP